MSKKDYELVAGAFNRAVKNIDPKNRDGFDVFREIVENTAQAFEYDNPRFDKIRFVEAVYRGKWVE